MAQDNQTNLFDGGGSMDVSKTSIPPNKYYKALNFRVTTDKGLSTSSLENIKGNLELIEIPSTSEVKKLVINYTSIGPTTITISNGITSGSSSTPFVTSSGTTSLDLYNHLNNDPGFNTVKLLYKIYYNSNAVLFVGNNVLDIFTISSTIGAIIVTDDFVPSQVSLETIGSTYINDDIYLLTTNNTSQAPGKTDPSSYGQIWKLVINDENLTATLDLIYNNQLNFSTYNAIAPTAILGRYENQNIQRIYWTDFYNRIRTLNVADPQAFATDLSLVYITPSVKFDVPILKKLTPGGTNLVGSYQLAYRLTKVSGAITAYSEPSDLVNLVATDENIAVGGANFVNYVGEPAGTSANKIITWNINNIDTSFDRIELVIIIRYANTLFPNTQIDVLAKFADLPIESDGSMIVTFSGNETRTPITINELLITYENFAFAKTMTTKDNRLIIGNVKSALGSLDTFDARAYRAKTSSLEDIYLTNNGIESLYNLSTLYNADLNPETKDNINNYTGTNVGKYKPNSTKLGGQGKFISYEFGTYSTMCDYQDSFSDLQGVPGLRHTNNNYSLPDTINLGIAGQDHDQNGINDSLKYAYKANLLKGYQREEIYRFAIQFYDKSGNPYFVKWIGDIKFPSYFDVNSNPDSLAMINGINDFRLIFYDNTSPGTPRYFLQQLYIKFRIDIPADLAAIVGYYNIVRVERSNTNKTVYGSGLIFPTFAAADQSHYAGFSGSVTDTQPTSILIDFKLINFQIPEFLFGGYYSAASGLDTVKLEANVVATNNTPYPFKPDVGTPIGGEFGLFKMYDFQPNSAPAEIAVIPGYSQRVNTAATAFVAPFDFFNYQLHTDNSQWVGTDTLLLQLTSAFSGADYLADNERIYFGTYRRKLDKQYGGNSYSERSNSTYMSCNNVQIIQGPGTFESKVFGGDTFVGLMDNERCIRNIGTDGIPTPATDPIYSRIYFFPCESSMNTELRTGGHANKDLIDSSATAWDYHEDYFYNPAFKNENNIKKYFPKPDPFLQNNEFINRFYASEIKINGELTDSWSIFKSLNYYDVEGSYGPINGVSMLQDEVYFIQDKAFGKLSINPKEVLTTKEGSSVGLGRGGILDNHEYISTEIGSKHQFSFLKSAYQLFFIDSRHKKIYSFSQNKPLTPLSDIEGIHSWMINNFTGRIENIDKPVYVGENGLNGVHGIFDFVNNELIYTFFRSYGEDVDLITNKDTMVINQSIEAFTGFYSHTPKIYITNNKKFISADITNGTTLQDLFLHNYGDYGRFYGLYKPSEIELYSNKAPQITKVFDTLMFQTELQNGNTLIDLDRGLTPLHETFNTLEVSTDFQDSGIITLNSTNMNRNFRSWRTPVPRNSTQAAYVSTGLFARMRDKYLKIKLSFMNNENKRLIVHNIISFFRFNQPK
jgi:hypothetical protein